MSGLGFKDFQVGEVLTSADVDGYLMQQAVMRFADAGARGSALGTAPGTAVALAEGMVSYLDDTNRVELFDGSVWKPTGLILQVVSTTKTDTFFTTSQSFTPVTGLSASITPSASTSKVLVLVQLAASTQQAAVHFQLLRDATVLDVRGDAASNRVRGFGGVYQGGDPDLVYTVAATYLDSPATTSSTTYSVEVRVGGASFNGAYVNRSYTDTDSAEFGRAASSITLIEVAA